MNNKTKQNLGIAAAVIVALAAIAIGIYFATKDKKSQDKKTTTQTPGITVDGVDLEASGGRPGVEGYRIERYDLGELSSGIQIRVNWTNDDGWNDVTNLYFRRKHGNNTKETEASASQRQSNSSHEIILTPNTNENMVGDHTIEVLYKIMGNDTKTLLTTINTTVTEDQITLALDSLQSSPLEFSLPDFSSSATASVWSSEQNFVRLDPNPSGFDNLQFVPSGSGIKIKRLSDKKFLKINTNNQGTWTSGVNNGNIFYLGFFESVGKYRIGTDNNHGNNTRYLVNKRTPTFIKKKDITVTDKNLFEISEVTVDELVCDTDFPTERARTTHMNNQIGKIVSEVVDSLQPYPNDQALFNEFLETRSNLISMDDTFNYTHLGAFGILISAMCSN